MSDTPRTDSLVREVIDAQPFPLGSLAEQPYEAVPASLARELEHELVSIQAPAAPAPMEQPAELEDVLLIVESYGPIGNDINESFRYQIILRDEVMRLRALASPGATRDRDTAEEAVSEIYYRIIGRSPEWSNLFGFKQAIEEIIDAFDVVRAVAKSASNPPQPLPEAMVKAELLIEAAAIGMADLIALGGAYETLSQYRKHTYDRLSELHKIGCDATPAPGPKAEIADLQTRLAGEQAMEDIAHKRAERAEAECARLAKALQDLYDVQKQLETAVRDNAALREALEAVMTMSDRGPKPRKLDEALSWRENDEKARAMALAALAQTNPEQHRASPVAESHVPAASGSGDAGVAPRQAGTVPEDEEE